MRLIVLSSDIIKTSLLNSNFF